MSDVSALNLWVGRPQASRRKVVARITVAGQDVTNAVFPHLQQLVVITKRGGVSTCALDLDDRDGRLVVPGFGTSVVVDLGWHTEGLYQIFNGTVDSVECGFERKAGGRRMWVDARGWVTPGFGKTPMHLSWGEGGPPGKPEGTKVNLGTVLQDFAKRAGYSLKIAPNLASIERDFWHTGTTSFHHFADQLASELGAAFSISGGVASFTDILTPGYAADGTVMGVTRATWGENLIAYRIKPYVSRPQWDSMDGRYYDIQKSGWLNFKGLMGSIFGKAQSILQLPLPAPNKTVSDQQTRGQKAASLYEAGQGWVSINGEPTAVAGGIVNISGARDGVDGTWAIEEVHHTYDRAGGYVTRLATRFPFGETSAAAAAGLAIFAGEPQPPQRFQAEPYPSPTPPTPQQF